MENLLDKDNLALITSRMTKGEVFQHTQVSRNIIEVICMSPKTSNNGFVFPLYLYPTEKRGLFDEETNERKPNFSDEFIKDFSAKLKLEFTGGNPHVSKGAGSIENDTLANARVSAFTPEDVFNYAYAVFHSPTYRARYAEFLKIDFPRLPLTSNTELFRALVGFGSRLVELHLLENDLETNITFPEKGSNEVEFVKYELSVASALADASNADNHASPNGDATDKMGKVFINKTQYFENVPETAWNFHIGGYQVLQKWLKDRKGRTLSFDDLEHYAKVVSALSQTIELMQKIDQTIEANGGFPIE